MSSRRTELKQRAETNKEESRPSSMLLTSQTAAHAWLGVWSPGARGGQGRGVQMPTALYPGPTPQPPSGCSLGTCGTMWVAAQCSTHHIMASASLRGTNTPHPEASSLGDDPARKPIPESPP
jgi:hypothetical protein